MSYIDNTNQTRSVSLTAPVGPVPLRPHVVPREGGSAWHEGLNSPGRDGAGGKKRAQDPAEGGASAAGEGYRKMAHNYPVTDDLNDFHSIYRNTPPRAPNTRVAPFCPTFPSLHPSSYPFAIPKGSFVAIHHGGTERSPVGSSRQEDCRELLRFARLWRRVHSRPHVLIAAQLGQPPTQAQGRRHEGCAERRCAS